MGEIPKPTPVVFRVQTTDSLFFSSCVTVLVASFLSIFVAGILASFLSPPNSVGPLAVIWFVFAAPSSYLALRKLYRDNHTKARIEVSSNIISLFDRDGNLVVSDDLGQIAQIYNSRFRFGSRGQYTDYFHLLFSSGNLLTFSQHLENNFTLEKMIKGRVGHNFELIDWSDYEMMELEKKESRAEKAKRIPIQRERVLGSD